MKHILIRALKRCAALLLAAALLLPPSAAAEEAPTVLRVAFPQVKGFTMTAEDGTRQGLVVDYLNEIAKYTGWEYEYIDTDAESMMDEFFAGDYDLVGGTYHDESLEDVFAYPDHCAGHAKSVLLARWDDPSIRGYNLNDLDGKTIGVHARATENVRRLKEFLSINGLDCTIRSYTPEEIRDGNLFYYLESRKVDLLLGNSGDDTGRFRPVAYFDAQAHYIVTTPGNQEVLDGLNWAMEQILESNPDFAEERYEANFPSSGTLSVSLNDGEKAYVQGRGPVRVAVPANYHPFFCMTSPNRIHDGLVPDLLERVSDFSGLQFNYLYVDTYARALDMVRRGDADMAGFFLGSESEAVRDRLSLTQPYASLSDLVVRNKAVSYPDEGLTCALLDGQRLPSNIMAEEVLYYDDVNKALTAVNSGRVDFLYGLSARIELEMQQHHLANIVPISLFGNTNRISFALPKPADPLLLTILNKTITNLSETEKSALANQNLISMGASSLSLSDWIYANPLPVVTALLVILLLVIAIVAIAARARVKAVVMHSELEKAEADNRAKSGFLSRMSHEIRTPMNAILGFADLISMQEGLPEALQENLVKLRSSSRYLLSLLNDILDMSRIDSGMLTIVSEPFSMTRMLDELKSMMAAEAGRREVALKVDARVEHPALSGDSIRLRQVLTNLISNAIKFTPPRGEVLLRVVETGADENGASFSFHVVDSGIGIPPEDQSRIFEAFEQAGGNSSRSQGTGLGLPISRNIVRLMGGELRLKSESGVGSEFYFTITLPYGEPVTEPENTAPADLLAQARLLLVEDNDLNAEIASELLEMQGARVTRAADGAQAVALISSSEPGAFHAVLMDIQMPVMNGLEATRAIRALERADAASIPIVAMTANSFQEDIDAAMSAGMNGFVSKPLDVDYLYGILRELLHKQ